MTEDQRFDAALNRAVDIIGGGSKNRFCGEMDITTSHFYSMTKARRFSPGISLEVEVRTKGQVRAIDLCPRTQ